MGRTKKLHKELGFVKENISDIFNAIENEHEDEREDEDFNQINDLETNKSENLQKMYKKGIVTKESLSLLNSFVKKFPELNEHKNKFISEIFNDTEKKFKSQKLMATDDYVVEKLVFNNITYYKDEDNNLINDKMELIGFIEKNGEYYECYFF